MRTPKTYRHQTQGYLSVARHFSRYMPHQSEQEKARRVRQREWGLLPGLTVYPRVDKIKITAEEREEAARRQYVGNMVPTWHMDEHGNVAD